TMKKLVLFACSVLLNGCILPSSIRVQPKPIVSPIAISVVEQRKVISHPVQHPTAAYRRVGTNYQPAADESFPQQASGSLNTPELSMERFFVHHVHEGLINTLAVSEDGSRAYSGGQDGKVVLSTIVRPLSRNNQAKVPLLGSQLQSEVLLESSKPILALGL